MGSRFLACFILLCASARGQVSLESCKVSLPCENVRELFSSGETEVQTVRGPPGKRGPPGPKGEPAERCECESLAEVRASLQQLQARIGEMENASRVPPTARPTATTADAHKPTTCAQVSSPDRYDTGGVFTIYPLSNGSQAVQVYCDLKTDGGGWLVFQKRQDGSENFDRGWVDYVRGFGNLDGEFWLGLEKLHQITRGDQYEMRIDMEDFEGNKTYAAYRIFSVGPGSAYRLHWEGYSGPLQNGLLAPGTKFSTKDNDQDTHPRTNCAEVFKGGWWHTNCHHGNPNGFYYGGRHSSYADGVNWQYFRGLRYSLKTFEMKIRKF